MAAAVPDLLDNVHTVLTVVGFGNNHNRFINIHRITSMDDFRFMDPDEVEQIMKMYNDRQIGANVNRKLGFMVQKKLQGLLYWYHNRVRRQIAVAAGGFDNNALSKALRDMKVEASNKDNEVEMEVVSAKIKMEWWKWKTLFVAAMDIKIGYNEIPIA